MATIVCEACGATRTRTPSNTRLCKLCAITRDLAYWSEHKRVCSQTECKRSFAPLRRNDHLCGHCAVTPFLGECLWCKQYGDLVQKEIQICMVCAKDAARRPALVKALRVKQAARLAANEPINDA